MLVCLILVVALPSILSIATFAALAVGAIGAEPVYPDSGAYVVRETAVYSPAPPVEYDRRGRRLPPRDARGRFVKITA